MILIYVFQPLATLIDSLYFIYRKLALSIFQWFYIHAIIVSVSSRSRAEDVRDNDDVFEDALLEHLNDLQENQEDYGNYMYDDEVEDENDQYSRKRLLHMLDYIKKEASKHQQLKKSIESNADENIAVRSNTKKESDASEPNRNIAKSNDGIETNFKKTISKKEESHDHIEIIDVAKDKRGVSDEITNSQEATVIPDDTIDKQNEIDKTVNLRSVLEPAVTNAPSNTTTASKMPSHGHIKQTITSSKDNKMGLDKVSFIGRFLLCSFSSHTLYLTCFSLVFHI